MKIIVTTGMPSAGKTTLISQLVNKYDVNLLTLGDKKRKNSLGDDYYVGLRTSAMAMLPLIRRDKPLICDRFIIDELVFGMLFNRQMPNILDDLANLHSLYEVTYVFLDCGYGEYQSRLGPAKFYYSESDFKFIRKAYLDALQKFEFWQGVKVIYHTDCATLQTLAKQLDIDEL